MSSVRSHDRPQRTFGQNLRPEIEEPEGPMISLQSKEGFVRGVRESCERKVRSGNKTGNGTLHHASGSTRNPEMKCRGGRRMVQRKKKQSKKGKKVTPTTLFTEKRKRSVAKISSHPHSPSWLLRPEEVFTHGRDDPVSRTKRQMISWKGGATNPDRQKKHISKPS